MVKCFPTMGETQVQSLGWKNPLEKKMATHFSTLPWMEEPGRLQSMGSQRDITERLHFHFQVSISVEISTFAFFATKLQNFFRLAKYQLWPFNNNPAFLLSEFLTIVVLLFLNLSTSGASFQWNQTLFILSCQDYFA